MTLLGLVSAIGGRAAAVRRGAALGGVVFATSASAGQLDRTVIGELLQPSGWSEEDRDASTGLVVSSKPLRSVGLTAYMGVRDLPAAVDPERLWKVISDVADHDRFATRLEESTVVQSHGGGIDFYQVIKPPPLLASVQRYWLVHTELERNVGGVTGHHRRCWSKIASSEMASTRAKIVQRYPNATEVALTHGCWEVVPARDTTPARLRYRTVSDPGGSLPRSVADLLTTRAMPDNLDTFVRQASR